ncbi:MAG: MarR family winged helix-turn-helix transcriptional regulator [Bacteroidia bacterium]
MARQIKAKTPVSEEIQTLEQQLLQMRDAFRFHQNDIRRKYNLSATGMEIIFFVNQEGPQQMKVIGEKFEIKFSTLTSLIDKIEKSGLVKRVNSKEDRRSILVQVTRKGGKMLGEYDQQVKDLAATIKVAANGNTPVFLKTLEKVTPEL